MSQFKAITNEKPRVRWGCIFMILGWLALMGLVFGFCVTAVLGEPIQHPYKDVPDIPHQYFFELMQQSGWQLEGFEAWSHEEDFYKVYWFEEPEETRPLTMGSALASIYPIGRRPPKDLKIRLFVKVGRINLETVGSSLDEICGRLFAVLIYYLGVRQEELPR